MNENRKCIALVGILQSGRSVKLQVGEKTACALTRALISVEATPV